MEFDSYRDFYIESLVGGKLDYELTGFIFRGESKSTYRLLPSSLRKNKKFENMVLSLVEDYGVTLNLNLEYDQIVAECLLLQNFYTSVNNQGLSLPELSCFLDTHIENNDIISEQLREIIVESMWWPPKKLWHIMALAQHYGIPTRFLDWTYEKNIAAYFAISGYFSLKKEERDPYIIIWAINSKYFSNTNNAFKFIIPTYYNNPNLCAQQGVLSCLTINTCNIYNDKNIKKKCVMPLDQFFIYAPEGLPTCLYRFKISTSNILNDFIFINKLGYTANKLFPGYGSVYKYLEDRNNIYKFKHDID